MYDIVKSEKNLRTVHFTESADRISAHYREIRRKIMKDFSMPGFRPGKVPRSIIDKQYGNMIRAEVADIVRQELTSDIIEREDWILDDNDAEGKIDLPVEGKPYNFEITFSLFETPEPKGIDGIKIVLPTLDTETAVGKMIDSFREKMVTFETVDRPAEKDDLVLLKASPVDDSGKPQEFSVRIGESQIGPGFDELILGVIAGSEFAARMDGGTGDSTPPVHKFSAIEVKQPVLPELDDEFASKAAGVDSMEELRRKVEESVRNRFDQEIVYLKEREVIDSLLESNPFDPPEYMVHNLTKDYLDRLEEDNPGKETRKAAKELALKKVREFLILKAVTYKENISITEEDIESEKSPEESALSVIDRLKNRRVMELILDRADITEEEPRKDEVRDKDLPEEEQESSSWRWIRVDDTEAEQDEEIAKEEKS